MDDFASALVLAMVRRSLDRQSAEVPTATVEGSRTVHLAEKQALLDSVLSSYGPEAILRVADLVPEFADHPIAGVFAGCRTPRDVLASWFAIERYFHSRHRTRIVNGDDTWIAMEHFDVRAGENLVVAGLIFGILRWRGARGAELRIGSTVLPTDPAVSAEQTHRWAISWQGFDPPQGTSWEPGEGAVPAVDFAGRAISDPHVTQLFAEQLGALHIRRSAAETARTARTSLRTLQRRLADAGWSRSQIVASARVHVATRLLALTDTPLALVGLLAGYSDQPHFQRSFRATVGPTPGEYRRMARGMKSSDHPIEVDHLSPARNAINESSFAPLRQNGDGPSEVLQHKF
ncbi:MAG: helix-turn-helix transcriptional regulator [Pseudorhizobium sp.]